MAQTATVKRDARMGEAEARMESGIRVCPVRQGQGNNALNLNKSAQLTASIISSICWLKGALGLRGTFYFIRHIALL